jgi:hypothetical protein
VLCENKNFSSRTPARRKILTRNGLSSLARNITARPCETLLPPNLTGPKGGLRPSKRGVEPAFWVPAASYRNNTLFLIVRTYVHMGSHFLRDQGCKTRPRSCKKSHVPISQGLAARPNSNANHFLVQVQLRICNTVKYNEAILIYIVLSQEVFFLHYCMQKISVGFLNEVQLSVHFTFKYECYYHK